MTLKSTARFLALLLFVVPALSAGCGEVIAWKNGRWFDGTGFRPVDVYTNGTTITLEKPRRVSRTVNLSGRFITPAFAEAHNHSVTDRRVADYLRDGVFYVMVPGNSPELRAELGQKINAAGKLKVALAHGLFTATGGHPTALVRRNIERKSMTAGDLDGGFLHPVDSCADVDRTWDLVLRQRPDFIKIVLAYSEDYAARRPHPADSDRYGLDPAVAACIVEKAHGAGLRVAAHVESAYDFETAVRCGADVIAHMPASAVDLERLQQQGPALYEISEDAARLAGARGVVVVTTLGGALLATAGQEAAPMRAGLVAVSRHNFELLAKHGVRIALGSDDTKGTAVGEALELHAAGLMSALQLLNALAVTGPRAVDPRRRPSLPLEGAPADFLVLDADPLSDFASIRKIRMRVLDGKILPP